MNLIENIFLNAILPKESEKILNKIKENLA